MRVWATRPDDFQCANVDQRFMFAIQRVKMRRCMLAPEHLNHDSKKLADRRHNISSFFGLAVGAALVEQA